MKKLGRAIAAGTTALLVTVGLTGVAQAAPIQPAAPVHQAAAVQPGLTAWAGPALAQRTSPPAKINWSRADRLAVSLSYPLMGNGKDVPKRAFTGGKANENKRASANYKKVRAAAIKKAKAKGVRSLPAKRAWANCGSFIATVLNVTVDPRFPGEWVATQRNYLHKKGKKNGWKRVGYTSKYNAKAYKPGDIFLTTAASPGSNHIFMWVGNWGGKKEVISEASVGSNKTAFLPALSINKMNRKTGKDSRGRGYEIWRYVGKR